MSTRLLRAALAGLAVLALSGCYVAPYPGYAYGPRPYAGYGYGYHYGYHPYGYR